MEIKLEKETEIVIQEAIIQKVTTVKRESFTDSDVDIRAVVSFGGDEIRGNSKTIILFEGEEYIKVSEAWNDIINNRIKEVL